jgi:hypothetical protein
MDRSNRLPSRAVRAIIGDMNSSTLFQRAGMRVVPLLSCLLLTALPASAVPASDPATLLARIDAARGTAACDSDAQCHSIGIGAKACGGPERYLAWSSKDSDGARLRALVEEHAQSRRAADAKAEMMSTCSIVTDPGARCASGRCVLRQSGPGGNQAR